MDQCIKSKFWRVSVDSTDAVTVSFHFRKSIGESGTTVVPINQMYSRVPGIYSTSMPRLTNPLLYTVGRTCTSCRPEKGHWRLINLLLLSGTKNFVTYWIDLRLVEKPRFGMMTHRSCISLDCKMRKEVTSQPIYHFHLIFGWTAWSRENGIVLFLLKKLFQKKLFQKCS